MTNDLIDVRQTCRCCGSKNIKLSVPLAQVPIVSPNVGVTGEEITKLIAPLDNYMCEDCGLSQLIHVVDPSLIYRNYLYRTSVSAGLREHFKGLCDAGVEKADLKEDDFVVEFGSNDGTLLGHFKELGMEVQGVDPAEEIAQEATDRGIPTRGDFFDQKLADEISSKQRPADLILSNNVLANIDDLAPIFEGVKILMAENGAYVFETQYALDVFEKYLLDVIYHEHISCFSIQPLVKAFKQYGLEVFDADRIATKGGSIRVWVQHENGPRPISERVGELVDLENKAGLYDFAYHKCFSDHIISLKNELHAEIFKVKGANGKVAAWGTSVGCAALIHQFELEDKIDFFLDDSPFKDRLEGPGYDLPVHQGKKLMDVKPDLVVVLAWRYANMIIPKHQEFMNVGGRFIIPLTDISIYP